jgi:glutamyl-tRNA synthetase
VLQSEIAYGCIVNQRVGRFAPSPTGDLHLGNLRTALVAQLSVGANSKFIIRMEDLDRATSSREVATRQLTDLAAIGIESDVPVVFQSDRFALYREHLARLTERGLTFECFCTRKEIQQAASAPHGATPRYPGTCREMSESARRARAAERPAALRLRGSTDLTDCDRPDDVVLVRNDGVPAYNLAVVVDDELQGVTQVVRGEDLAHVTPSQIHLQKLLGFATPEYLHVPLLCGPDGHRLSKRHGDVTLTDCLRLGFSPDAVRVALLRSLEVGTNGWDTSSSLAEWLKSLL